MKRRKCSEKWQRKNDFHLAMYIYKQTTKINIDSDRSRQFKLSLFLVVVLNIYKSLKYLYIKVYAFP